MFGNTNREEPRIITFTSFNQTREEKIRSMIRRCIETDIEIPQQWVDEYNTNIESNKKV